MPKTPNGPTLAIPDAMLARLRTARRALALTGAGVSAASGIPTFRAPGAGLWSQYSPSVFATPRGWARDPQLVWGWYTHRRRLALRAQPNAAHTALAALEAYYPTFTLVTQNVDGLHQRAGSQQVVELHGSLYRFRCSRENTPVDWRNPDDNDPAALAALERGETSPVPHCPTCDALLRPDVVWFEEALPEDAYAQAEVAARDCEVCLVVGTSALVWPAAGLPLLAADNDALLIEINPEATDLTRRADLSVRMAADVALPQLVRLLA
ncbi:MAG TPA: NAD-dependent deacylase [Ktedonobacterales bacterium]|nr:NAD-dependent deacylase [Ktedonobacterales bacterium]